MSRTLLRGGSILTLDPVLGDIEGGDLLIEDDEIREVGRNVRAPGAESVDAGGFHHYAGFRERPPAHLADGYPRDRPATGRWWNTFDRCTRASAPGSSRKTYISRTS